MCTLPRNRGGRAVVAGKFRFVRVHYEVGINLAAIFRINKPRQKYRHEFRFAGFRLTPQAMQVVMTVRRGFQDDLGAGEIRHCLHQGRHLDWQVVPECDFRRVEQLSGSRSARALATGDGDDVPQVDPIED